MQQPEDKTKNVVDLSKHRDTNRGKKARKIGPNFTKKQRSENAFFKKAIAFVQLAIILGILAWLSRSCSGG